MSAIWITFAIYLAFESFENFFVWRFLRGLKKDHQRHWELGGRRTIWSDLFLFASWPTIRFLREREYLRLNDPDGITYCEKHRQPVIVSYFASVLGAIPFLVALMFLI